MTDTSRFDDALTRLYAEIAEAEKRLADLQLKRKGAELFLDYMGGTSAEHFAAPAVVAATTSRTTSQAPSGTWQIVESVIDKTGTEQAVDAIWDALKAAGHSDLDRVQVRNSLHYLSRKGLIRAGSVRGRWRWIVPENSEAPVSAGASEGEESSSDSSRKEGGTASGAEPPTDRDSDQDNSWLDHGLGHRASVVGGA